MSPLERRYRRLLAAYPDAYRRRREEEMVSVLLESALPGQRWPRLGEALDLVGCGLRVRRASPSSLPARAAWADAWSITAVGLVGLLFVGAARTVAAAAGNVRTAPSDWGMAEVVDVVSQIHPTWRVDALWVAVALALAARAGRTAAALAAAATVLHLWVLVSLAGAVNDDLVVADTRSFAIGSVVTILLVGRPARGPRGVELVRRPRAWSGAAVRRVVIVGVVAAAFAVGAAVARDAVRSGAFSSTGWSPVDLAPMALLPLVAAIVLVSANRWTEHRVLRSSARSARAPGR